MVPNNPPITYIKGPYSHLSERSDPSDTGPCKPVALIAHDASMTLVTCSEAILIQDRQFHCQHTNYECPPNTASFDFIRNLKSKGYGVYTMNSDKTAAYEALPELDSEMLTDILPMQSNLAYQAIPTDLELHSVNEAMLDQLAAQQSPRVINPQTLLSEAVTFEDEGASSSHSIPNTGIQRLTITQKIKETLTRISVLSSTGRGVTNRDMTMMLSVLKVLQAHGEGLQKVQCVEKIQQTFTEFALLKNPTSTFGPKFTHLVSLGLIKITGATNSLGGFRYQLTPEGHAALNG